MTGQPLRRPLSLKDYLTKLMGVSISIPAPDECMSVAAFVKELHASPFDESLVHRGPRMCWKTRGEKYFISSVYQLHRLISYL
ncbi:hypothetical protein CR513_45169, partial [Mucuna pruriens]